jgi:autotransporter-associated beta strand protein
LAGFIYFSDDLSGVEGVKGNVNFAYRVVAEYENTAIGSGTNGYIAVDPAQTFPPTGGLFGWDMFTVLAVVDDGTTPPAITAQPQSQTNYVGANATFSVAATGGSLKYFWRFEGQSIAQQTNFSLVLTNLQLTNAGNYTVAITNSSGSITSAVAVLTIESAPPPGDRYWSGDGAAQGGAGTWDAGTPNRWGLAAAGPFPFSWNNNNVDNAIFGGTSGTVTLGADVTVNKITSSVNNYSVTGGSTITFSGTGAGVNISGNNLDFNCKLNGASLTKTGSGQISLNTSGNTVGKYIVSAGTLGSSVGNLGTPATLVADFVTLNGGNLGFEATSVNLGANRGVYLGLSGGLFGAKSGATVTFAAPITGPGGLTFPSSNFGQGNSYGANNIPYIFSNSANDYQGNTTVARGELRLGANDVLPDTTTVTISGANGQLNLNGKTDTVSGVIINGSGARIIDTAGGGVLSTAGTFDLRQSGSGSSGIVGILGGAGNVVKTTTNTVELSGVNTYAGNTTISAGTLALTGSGSFANSAAISIAASAVLDVTGRADGTLPLGVSQMLSGGGTVSGAVSVAGTLSPGSSPGALNTGSQIWNGGGAFDWEIASATGVAGTDWDTLNIIGNLDVQATSGNRFTVRVKSLNGASPGNLANFDNNAAASWTIASVSGSVQNFATNSFLVNYSAVSNDLAGGEFLIQAGTGVSILFTNNHPPIATPANYSRSRGSSWKIKISDLLAASTSDPDGHERVLVNAGVDLAPTRGTVSMASGYILYSPAEMNSSEGDSFSFRVKDFAPYRPGDTVREAFANITLTVTESYGIAREIAISGGSVVVQFAGIPGSRYNVERATDANFTENVTVLETVTVPGNGLFSVNDNNPPAPTGFYRLKYNPL